METAAALVLLTSLLVAPPKGPDRVWTGVELVGNRSVARAEILAHLPLPIGEPYVHDREQWTEWGDALRQRFGFHDVGMGFVRFADGRCYLVVNVVEAGDEELLRFRDPPTGSVALPAGLVALHERLRERQAELFSAGTPSGERSKGGFLDFSDDRMHEIALELVEAARGHREQLVRVIREDADPDRRAVAARLLNWAGDVEQSIIDVHELVDDPDVTVRDDITRFMLHYVDRLGATARHAVIDTMGEQARRPSHADRNKAVSALRRILVAHPGDAGRIEREAGPALEMIARQSILDNVGGVARAINLQIRVETMFDRYRRDSFAGVADVTAEALRDGAVSDAVIVDCRTDAERAVSMIPDAVTKQAFDADRDRYRGRTVVTYCTIGYRSGVYGKELRRDDLDVLNLRGGVLGWARAGGGFVDPAGHDTKRVHVYGKQWDLLPDGYESVTDSP